MKDIDIISIDPVTKKVTLDYQKGQKRSNNKISLLQKLYLNLLSAKGSNKDFPSTGNRVGDMVGLAYTPDQEEIFRVEIALAIDEVEEQILREQKTQNIDPEEKLRRIEIVNIRHDPNNLAWEVILAVLTEANKVEVIKL